MKNFTFFIVLLLIFQVGFAQKRAVNSEGLYKGVIRVKFSETIQAKVDVFSENLEKGHKLKARPQDGYVVTNMRAVDKLNEKFTAYKMKRVFRDAGKHEAKHRKFGLHLWYDIEFSSDTPVKQLISQYSNITEISMAQAIPEAKLVSHSITPLPELPKASPPSLSTAPNDPRFPDQWHYENTGQNGGTPGSDISLLEAWEIETGNPNVIVAIEDGGVDWDHEDLAGNMWVNPGEIAGNGIDDDNNGYVDDVYGYNFANNTGTISVGDHGTHVAGTVAAETNNGIGVAGVAGGNGNNNGVRLMSCNVFTDTSNGGFAEAFTYAADNGAVISQNSWGYSNKGVYDQAVLDAIDYFIANAGGPGEAMNGGLVVIAAGNDDDSGLWYPGCYESALAVGAVNCKDEKAWYSNYDTWVDISAPGGELISSNTDPTAVHSTLPNNQYGVMQGTSMACPHVSGVAALIVSKYYGNITPQQVWDKLVNTTDNIDATIPTFIGKLGSGRMNAFAALSDGNPPATPTGLVASNVKATSFDLTWDASSGASSYDIQIRESGGTWSNYTSSSNAYSYTGATAETTYEFQVRAVNSAGNSDYTSIGNVSTTALPPLPDIPANITVSNITANSFSLSWDAANYANDYDVQVRPQGGSWISYNTSNISQNITNLQASTVYEYQVRSNNDTGSSDYSAIASTTTSDVQLVYCDSQGNNSTYEWISDVTIGTFNNTSGAANYTDFTSLTVDLNAGDQYNISLSPAFSGSSYNEYWKIWIDYDQDGTFNDSDELAFDAGSLSKTTVTGSITIPSSVSGTTRMRVSMKYNASQTACESFSYGEVEDYTVNIQAASQNPPPTPDGITASNITSSSFSINWNSVATATSYDIDIREQGGNWSSFNTTSASYDYTGANASTTYEYRLRANNSFGSSDYSSTYNLTTNAASLNYCSSKGNNSSYEWIDLVQLGNIDNSTGNDSGYADYTNLSTDLVPGSSQTIYFSAGFRSSSYTEFWHVWIDFNQNGTFDSNELMVSGSSSSSGTLSETFTVPNDASLGNTRMRVTMKYNSAADPCETFSYGEVEDYTVNITNTSSSAKLTNLTISDPLGNEAPTDLLILSPNPARDYVKIETRNAGGKIKIVSMHGNLIKVIPVVSNTTEVNVSNLVSGTYLIILEDERNSETKKLIKR
ncbi:S8 family serine peptidase [Marinifilum sp. D714]|uniref:S8 family serine peptidase n=1 Tax=Marinifilum sp. D714 TaxID=2937523 RepID=UPI0027C0E021|nr:S8 family serine peptidase [Marinifilum sp. D714]MDQ2178988.1 S8 family serine peptidase [Marinifilum sp. D714]